MRFNDDKRLQRYVLWCIVAMTTSYGTAHAQIGAGPAAKQQEQTGPTLEATQAWLVEKAAARFNDYKTGRLSFSGCSMTYVETVGTAGGPITYTNVVKHLANLDTDSINVHEFDITSPAKGWSTVVLQTLGERATIPHIQDPAPDGSVYTREYDWIKIYFKDQELGERAKNAFEHAIRLCVKQRADQKAAEPARPKEIF